MNPTRQDRSILVFMLATLGLDLVLGAVEIAFSLGPRTLYLTTFILGLSIGQMALSLILWMRDVSRCLVTLGALVISFLFGLTVSMHERGADFDRILVVLVATLIFGIAPVAIYRVVFVGLQVQFSLSILFGLMTLVTIACAVTIQLELDAEWFLTYLFFFISSAIPIPLAGFMLVRRRVPSTYRYVLMMALLIVIFVIVAASAEGGLRDVSLVGQIGAFMSLYLCYWAESHCYVRSDGEHPCLLNHRHRWKTSSRPTNACNRYKR